MTVYNKADKDSFKEAVESILNQSIVPEQIVISEDGLLTNELEECIYKFQKETARSTTRRTIIRVHCKYSNALC